MMERKIAAFIVLYSFSVQYMLCTSADTRTNLNEASDANISSDAVASDGPFSITVRSSEMDLNGRIYMFMDSSKNVAFWIVYSCSSFVLNVDSFENRDVLEVNAVQIILNADGGAENVSLPGVNSTHTQEDVLSQIRGRNSPQNSAKFINGQICSREVNLTLESGIIGISSLAFEAIIGNVSVNESEHVEEVVKVTSHIDVVVVREIHIIDTVFLICVYVLEITEMLAFGSQLDLYVVKHTLRKPVAPLIGLSCQYIGMPLIAYAVAKAVASNSLAALGIFVAGICPGGGASNIYSYLMDGDLSLSISMTIASTILSLGMMPLWLYTLGREFYREYDVEIPYVDILVTLSVIFLPLAVGLFIKNRFPKVAKYIENITTVLVTVLAILLIVTGVYSSLYIFRLFSLQIIIIGCALPYVGFLLGGILAFICRRSWEHIKTIAIETGMQNTGIAIILLYNTFPDPLGDLSSVSPIAAEVMSPIPPLVLCIVYLIRKKCCPKYEKVCQKEDGRKYEVEMNSIKILTEKTSEQFKEI